MMHYVLLHLYKLWFHEEPPTEDNPTWAIILPHAPLTFDVSSKANPPTAFLLPNSLLEKEMNVDAPQHKAPYINGATPHLAAALCSVLGAVAILHHVWRNAAPGRRFGRYVGGGKKLSHDGTQEGAPYRSTILQDLAADSTRGAHATVGAWEDASQQLATIGQVAAGNSIAVEADVTQDRQAANTNVTAVLAIGAQQLPAAPQRAAAQERVTAEDLAAAREDAHQELIAFRRLAIEEIASTENRVTEVLAALAEATEQIGSMREAAAASREAAARASNDATSARRDLSIAQEIGTRANERANAMATALSQATAERDTAREQVARLERQMEATSAVLEHVLGECEELWIAQEAAARVNERADNTAATLLQVTDERDAARERVLQLTRQLEEPPNVLPQAQPCRHPEHSPDATLEQQAPGAIITPLEPSQDFTTAPHAQQQWPLLVSEPMNELRCPISHEVMHDPVLAIDGHCYERAEIVQWMDIHFNPLSPLTREPLNPDNRPRGNYPLIPCFTLRTLCQEWQHHHPDDDGLIPGAQLATSVEETVQEDRVHSRSDTTDALVDNSNFIPYSDIDAFTELNNENEDIVYNLQRELRLGRLLLRRTPHRRQLLEDRYNRE